ncbi:MAG: hypothetical protein APF81_23075 [Desulfosporosinus sp. BRH_c37]|nr:MAG: hypothetical protein APF81_23075 [Desulfosporosinus sp. BRH_c37]
MKERFEVMMAGSGGQGLVTSGIMLGEAAILEGKNVAQTQSYGIATRGGFSSAAVIIDREEIIFQQVEQPDIVLAFTEEAMEKFAQVDGTPVFYDTTLLKKRTGQNFYGFPFTKLATDLGKAGAANMIALGAMSALTGLVKAESLAEVVRQRFSAQALDLNLRALQIGADLIGSGMVGEE